MPLLPRPIDLLNKLTGTRGLVITRDIPYGSDVRQRLDIYAPSNAAPDLPVIVFFYGGSWQSGHRADYLFLAAHLARLGFIVAIPDYRIYPKIKFPDFVADCAAAVAYVSQNISKFGGKSEEIFLVGHSAGAYNAVMLGLNADFLAAHGASANHLAGIVGLSGPYDFLPLRDSKLKDIFSPPADIALTQPITYARDGAPPLFLLHGGADRTVLPRNMTALAAKIRQHGGVVETKIYPKLGHIGIILAALPFLAWRAPVWDDIAKFVAACRNGDHAAACSELETPVIG